MSDWLDVLKGDKSIEDSWSLLKETASRLDALLKAEPRTEQRVLDILHHHLAGPKAPDSWDQMLRGVRYCLGEDISYMLVWLVQDAGTPERLTTLQEHVSPAAAAFFGAILGVYGADLRRAYDAWNEVPDNWHSVSREVFFDQLSQVHRLVFRIRKFNDEEVVVEGPPVSFVGLATSLVMTLRLVGQPEVYAEEAVDGFLDEVAQFVHLLGKRDRLTQLLDAHGNESEADA